MHVLCPRPKRQVYTEPAPYFLVVLPFPAHEHKIHPVAGGSVLFDPAHVAFDGVYGENKHVPIRSFVSPSASRGTSLFKWLGSSSNFPHCFLER